MVVAPINHIYLDERGIAYIDETTLKVTDIVIDTFSWKLTPQEIQDNYPFLSLAQIHAALSYYYDHVSATDAQIAQSVEETLQLRAEFPNPLTREQLNQRLSSRPEKAPTE